MILYKGYTGEYGNKKESLPIICANFVEHNFNIASPKIRVRYSLKYKRDYLKITIWAEDYNMHRYWCWTIGKFDVPQDMYSSLESMLNRKFPEGGKHDIYLKITSL